MVVISGTATPTVGPSTVGPTQCPTITVTAAPSVRPVTAAPTRGVCPFHEFFL